MPQTMELAAHRWRERSSAAIAALVIAAIVLLGTRTTTQDHVGEVVSLVDISEQGVDLCRALVVSPHLVLTAAHCTFHPDGGYLPLVTKAANGDLYETETILYPTDRFMPGELQNDLALIRTRERIGTSQPLNIDPSAPVPSTDGLSLCMNPSSLTNRGLLCANTGLERSGTPVLSSGLPVAVTVAKTPDQTIYTPLAAHAAWYNELLDGDEPSSQAIIRALTAVGAAALTYLAVTLMLKRRRLSTSRTLA